MLNRIKESDLLWLAGLMEGEGSFYPGSPNHSPNLPWVTIKTTDEDVIARVSALWGVTYVVDRNKMPEAHHKIPYSCRVRGRRAVYVMWWLRPYMGKRRTSQIDKALESAAFYKTGPRKTERKVVQATAADLKDAALNLIDWGL